MYREIANDSNSRRIHIIRSRNNSSNVVGEIQVITIILLIVLSIAVFMVLWDTITFMLPEKDYKDNRTVLKLVEKE